MAVPVTTRVSGRTSGASRLPAWRALVETRVTGVALIVVLLLLWEVSARWGWVKSSTWPPVSLVIANTVEGIVSGNLLSILGSTLWRMFAGFFIGSTLAVILGLVLGSLPVVYRYVNPLIEAIRPIPTPAIIPPLILFLGVDDGLKIFIVSLASFFPVLVNTVGGVRGTSDVLLQTARTFRTGAVRTMIGVTLPSCLPAIFAGLRISLGLALVVAVVAEMISGGSGVGYFIIETQYTTRPEAMYSAVLCLSIVGYAINRSFLTLERRLLPWFGESQRREE